MRYASGTSVSEERSRSEIQYWLERFGADQFCYASDKVTSMAQIRFRFKGASFAFNLPLATTQSPCVRRTKAGKLRTDIQAGEAMVIENRRRWRSLALALKAMLVGVEDGIFNFGEVFLPYMIFGDGRTVGQSMLPQIEKVLAEGRSLPALPPLNRQLEASR
ncbi:MAG: hypothetical protein ABFD92_16700 [Planctomycetaceae bacterium]|nr:hypothetical protein [Planctomycetaceae bacterium]